MSIIIVFPGQGSQKTGMAQDFVEAYPVARQVFEEASDALNLDMASLCFEEDERLNLTEFTQPAIVTAEIAMWTALKKVYGLTGTGFGGHSLGEYSALVAAGVIPLSQAVRIVRERGRRMQEAVPAGIGAMAAIIQPDLPVELLQQCLDGLQVDIANHNAPNQVVISGEAGDVQTATERYQDQPEGMRAKIRMLTVSAPFHSRMMSEIEPGFRSLLFDAATHWNTNNNHQITSNTSKQDPPRGPASKPQQPQTARQNFKIPLKHIFTNIQKTSKQDPPEVLPQNQTKNQTAKGKTSKFH